MTTIVWWMVFLNANSVFVPASPNDWPDKASCEAVTTQINQHLSTQERRICVPHVRIITPYLQQPTTKPINSQRSPLT